MYTVITLVRTTGAVLQFVSSVCTVAAIATNVWYSTVYKDPASMELATLYMGLWKKCRQIGNNRTECMSWNTLHIHDKFDVHWAQVCQGLMIIGVVLNIHFLVISVLIRSTSPQQDNAVMKIVSFFCAGPYLMTVVVFAASYTQCLYDYQEGGDYGAGFQLTIAASIMTFIGARLYMVQEHGDSEARPLLTVHKKGNIA